MAPKMLDYVIDDHKLSQKHDVPENVPKHAFLSLVLFAHRRCWHSEPISKNGTHEAVPT